MGVYSERNSDNDYMVENVRPVACCLCVIPRKASFKNKTAESKA